MLRCVTNHFSSMSLLERGLGILMHLLALGISGDPVKSGFTFGFQGALDWEVLPTFSNRSIMQL